MLTKVRASVVFIALGVSLTGCTTSPEEESTPPIAETTANATELAELSSTEVQDFLENINAEVKDKIINAQKAAVKDGEGNIEGTLLSDYTEGNLWIGYSTTESKDNSVDIEIDPQVEMLTIMGGTDEFLVVSVAQGAQVESSFKGELAQGELEEVNVSRSTFTTSE